MKQTLYQALVVLVLVIAGLNANAQSGAVSDDTVVRLQEEALNSELAWDLLASLTSEVGPRMGGSAGDQAAVDWAVAKMQSLGFDRVWTEPVSFPLWLRNNESAALISPVVQDMAVTAIGGSPSTDGPLEAEIIQFDSIDMLEASSIDSVQGKIVFLYTRMLKSREGSGYGKAVANRSRGPFVAARKGASALLIRSVGTDSDRLAHTGMMSGSEPGNPVPSAAISNPDADKLMRVLGRGLPVRVWPS